jgi:hypothetical protein
MTCTHEEKLFLSRMRKGIGPRNDAATTADAASAWARTGQKTCWCHCRVRPSSCRSARAEHTPTCVPPVGRCGSGDIPERAVPPPACRSAAHASRAAPPPSAQSATPSCRMGMGMGMERAPGLRCTGSRLRLSAGMRAAAPASPPPAPPPPRARPPPLPATRCSRPRPRPPPQIRASSTSAARRATASRAHRAACSRGASLCRAALPVARRSTRTGLGRARAN